ncbi:MAG: hypothetical protein WC829_02235 [Hyphomicrobium sp.]|jgi:hypothetical protein
MGKIQKVGIPWYRPEDYPKLLGVFADADRLPATHADWLARAEQLEQQVRASGKRVERVYLDPDKFPAWCRERGLDINGQARAGYAAEVAMRHLGN